MFNFQHSQTTQNEFDKIAELLLKYPNFMQHLNLTSEKQNHHYIYF